MAGQSPALAGTGQEPGMCERLSHTGFYRRPTLCGAFTTIPIRRLHFSEDLKYSTLNAS